VALDREWEDACALRYRGGRKGRRVRFGCKRKGVPGWGIVAPPEPREAVVSLCVLVRIEAKGGVELSKLQHVGWRGMASEEGGCCA
jgi:hypothetical protein